MPNTPEDNPASDPLAAGGGAVDDLTPPSGQFNASQAFASNPTPGSSQSNDGGDLTIKGVSPVRPSRTTEVLPKTGARTGPLAAQGVGNPQDDLVIQDLSKEALLRNTQRVMFRGQMCPSLNGIPLVSKLGQGGMGAVYCGIHPRLQNRVAVKVLPLQMAAEDAGLVQRLIREAQIAAMIQSPHLAAVYDVNEEDGQFFIVMEYVPGLTMGQYLKQIVKQGHTGLSELDAIDVCIAATIGLDAAHQESVIHRDLKPENIMVPFKLRQQNVLELKKAKLMDLGLARSEKGKGSQSLTGMKVAMGTPGYMSPEQILNAKTASKPSDVYGMGATLYAMLTGRPPFKNDDEEDMMRVLFATVNETPAPLSSKRKDVSAAVENLVNTCLAKKPEDRYPDAQELVRALIACRKVLAPSSAFDDFESTTSKQLAPATRPAVYTPGLTVLPVNFDGRGGAQRGGKDKSGKKTWLVAGIGVASAAMLAGGAAVYMYVFYKPDQPSDKFRDEVINIHRYYYGDEFKAALHSNEKATTHKKYEAAVAHTKQNPGIKEIEQADINAAILIQLTDDLSKPDLDLDDVKRAREKLAKFVAATKDDDNEKKLISVKIQKIDDERNIVIDKDVAQDQNASAQKRFAALTDLELRDPANKLVATLRPEIEEKAKLEKAEELMEKAKNSEKDGLYVAALKHVREAMLLDAKLKSPGTVLESKIQSALNREKQKADLDAATRKLTDAYGKALGFLIAEDFSAADKAAEEADNDLADANKIDGDFKPAVQVAYLHQRIGDSKKVAEYRSDLAAVHKLLDESKFDEAEKKLEGTKSKKPADESGFEAADLQDRISRAQYAKALEKALALKVGPAFDDALAQAEIAIQKRPADEKGNTAAELKREIIQAKAQAKDHALYTEIIQDAKKLKEAGTFKDALAKIDEARDKFGTGKDATDLETEIVQLERKAMVFELADANKKRKAAELREQQQDSKFKADKANAKANADTANTAADKLLLAGKYADAITAYETGIPAAEFALAEEANALKAKIGAARKLQEENSPAKVKQRAIDRALNESKDVDDTELDKKIADLDAAFKTFGDKQLSARRDELSARSRDIEQRKTAEEQRKKVEATKQTFDAAVKSVEVGAYDDAARKLTAQGFTDAAAAFGELNVLLEQTKVEIKNRQAEYKTTYSEKVPGHGAEFDAFDEKYNQLIAFAVDKLKNSGVDGVRSALKAVRTENSNLLDGVTAKMASIKAQTFDAVVKLIDVGKYDDAARKLKSQGQDDAAAALLEMKELFAEKIAYIKSCQSAYTSTFSAKVPGRGGEWDALMESYRKMTVSAADKLRNSGVEGVRGAVNAVKKENADLGDKIDAKYAEIKAAFTKAYADELSSISRPGPVISSGNTSTGTGGKSRTGETKD